MQTFGYSTQIRMFLMAIRVMVCLKNQELEVFSVSEDTLLTPCSWPTLRIWALLNWRQYHVHYCWNEVIPGEVGSYVLPFKESYPLLALLRIWDQWLLLIGETTFLSFSNQKKSLIPIMLKGVWLFIIQMCECNHSPQLSLK